MFTIFQPFLYQFSLIDLILDFWLIWFYNNEIKCFFGNTRIFVFYVFLIIYVLLKRLRINMLTSFKEWRSKYCLLGWVPIALRMNGQCSREHDWLLTWPPYYCCWMQQLLQAWDPAVAPDLQLVLMAVFGYYSFNDQLFDKDWQQIKWSLLHMVRSHIY